MARFNINTFSPVYPESNDKRGEVQIVKIAQPDEVGENYTQLLRLDYLPVFKDLDLKIAPGRQTMYRTVKSNDPFLPWATRDPGNTNSFIITLGGGTGSDNISFVDFINENTKAYQASLNYLINDINPDITISICEVHVIANNIMFSERGAEHIFFQTYDCIFYGQQTPNPYIEPAPPAPECEVLPNYAFVKGFSIQTGKGINYVDPSNNQIAVVELYPKGGGIGVNFSTACTFNFSVEPDLNVGDYYAIKVDYTALPTGVTLPVTFKPNYITAGTAVLNDTGDSIYILAQKTLVGPINFRIETAAQSPTNIVTEPIFTVELFTPECIS